MFKCQVSWSSISFWDPLCTVQYGTYLWLFAERTHILSHCISTVYFCSCKQTNTVFVWPHNMISIDRVLFCCKGCLLQGDVGVSFPPPDFKKSLLLQKDNKWTSPKVCVLHSIAMMVSLRCPLSFCQPCLLYVWQKKRQTQGSKFACTQTNKFMYKCTHI